MQQVFNKFVRDRIPEKIESNGEKAYTRILSEEEYKIELEKKLNEEYQEVLSSSGKDRIEELADMLEIIKCLAALENSSLEEVEEVANQKVLKRGSFDKKIFLERTE
jgi:predicted house-cleaning noncanonical NTP pyrophosphatase (MazG superfamily)